MEDQIKKLRSKVRANNKRIKNLETALDSVLRICKRGEEWEREDVQAAYKVLYPD